MKRKQPDKLLKILSELELSTADHKLLREDVSEANIGWHIEHCLLIINAVIETLKTSDTKKFKRKINLVKVFFFAIGRFPRGKVRSPKSVIPKGDIDETSLKDHFKISRENLDTLKNLDKNLFFKHPIFGNLRKYETTYFLELHTKHHLKIIRAIRS